MKSHTCSSAGVSSWRSALTAAAVLGLTSVSLAIHPGRWEHTTEADFAPGEGEHVVVTNLGDIKLATNTATVADVADPVTVIYDLRYTANGDLYIAAGPEARLLRMRGGKIETVVELMNEQVFALDITADGGLLLAISGGKSRLAILDGDKLKTLVELPGIRYIWDTIVDGNDVYLATGTDGKLLHVNLVKVFAAQPKAADAAGAGDKTDGPKADDKAADKAGDKTHDKAADKATDGDHGDAAAKQPLPVGVRVLVDAAQANLLCLGRDSQGRIYAGSDTDGLLYRISLNPGGEPDVFVVYDAPEPEIGALLVKADGTVYVGTADADQARPGRLEAAVSAEAGRPITPANAPDLPLTPKPTPNANGATPKTPKTPNTPINKPNNVNPTKNKPAAPIGDAGKLNAGATSNAPDNTATKPVADKNGKTGDDASAPPPTPEQYDRLRDEIRKRLLKARQTGALQAAPSVGPSRPRSLSTPRSRPGGASRSSAKAGNAVYRIDASGFVTEVFRESVMILKLFDEGDNLLVATGNEGQLFRVNPAAEETTIVADLDQQQIPAMVKGPDGRILLGTANPSALIRLDEGFAAKGAYTSDVLDASQISLWGKLNLTGAIPEGATIVVQTRSGNVEDPDRAAWSKWSDPKPLVPDPKFTPLTPRQVTIASPPARFLQYRLTLTGNGTTTSTVDRVAIAYVVPNIKPVVSSISAKYPESGRSSVSRSPSRTGSRTGAAAAPAEQVALNVEWEASDANNDQLQYKLEYRLAGTKKWLPLADELTQNRYEWQTKRVPDGRYVIRVTASDAPDNPADMAKAASRQSDPVVIDNTPPAIGQRQTRIENGVTVITASVTDALSAVESVQYAVDSTEKWQPVLPDDLIYDSTTEAITVKIPDLSAGSHVVTLRASDALGNSQYVAEVVEIK